MTNDALLIWWSDTSDCQAIGNDLPEDFPEYLKSQYRDRRGRNGRGRLWVSSEFGNVETTYPWPTNSVTRKLGRSNEGAAGIVFRKQDSSFVNQLHGIVTDFDMNAVNDAEQPALTSVRDDPIPDLITPQKTIFDVKRSGRGFEYISIPRDGEETGAAGLLQASSAIGNYQDSWDRPGSSYLWIGDGDNRPHLNREQIAGLILHLQNWLDTGTLHLEEEVTDEKA